MRHETIKMLSLVYLLLLLAEKPAFSQVTVTEEIISIPTWLVGDPDPNPVFFNGRRYQGAQGRVYPYPLLHNLTDIVDTLEYKAVVIENEYIELCILPELGGRIYYARDKRNDYYFLYYNRVVKPALIGMTGAWTSGGVEWNIPHHHRATSFMPVEHTVTENSDGSITVWVGETELRHRSRWIAGVTLHPGSLLVETDIRVFNTTPWQNSILVWANAAVHANENYQVFFPPKTQYVTFHRKNQFSEWPVSRQFYDGADYTEGVDLSRWENHIKSTSFFEWGNTGNFVAGIDHGEQAGTVVFGDKYVNPGKKVWSWGNNPSGRMWDKLLTEDDGPYVELMFGSFSDNQPDYSWMQTLETKEARYWFAPLSGMSGIKEAGTNAMIDIEDTVDSLVFVINPTRIFEDAGIYIFRDEVVYYDEMTDLDPAVPYRIVMEKAPADSNGFDLAGIEIEITGRNGSLLAWYRHELPGDDPMPEPVEAPLSAGDMNDADSLYYSGLRFEQFHDPYYMPMDFYLKALEKDPWHVPSLTRAGIIYLKAGDYENAAILLSDAVERITSGYVVPENGAPLYYLGMAYVMMGLDADAYELFHLAAWDYSWRSPARYQLALIDSRRGNYYSALRHLREAWSVNTRSPAVLGLEITLRRLTGNIDAAWAVAELLEEVDPLNPRILYEKYLLMRSGQVRNDFTELMRNYHENYLELAVEYGNGGFVDEAAELLEMYNNLPDQSIKGYPVVNYLLGFFNHINGNRSAAEKYFSTAAGSGHEYSFPFRFETVAALETALEYNPDDALAWYLIGNIYYDHQPELAVDAWENCTALSDDIPAAYRNLAFARANIDNDPVAAIRNIEKALELDPADPRYYYEFDLYRKSLLADPQSRVRPFLDNHDIVASDQLTIFPYAELLTVTGNYDLAIDLMSSRNFHRWEGGESIYLFWLYAHLFKAVDAIEANDPEGAEELLDTALAYPENLQSVSSPYEPVAWFYKGVVAEMLKRPAEAEEYFLNAVQCRTGAPECDYFAARAYEKLKKKIASESIFESMVATGREELLAEEDMDFFDPFARVRSRNEIQSMAYLRMALGYEGMGDNAAARKYFSIAKEHNPALMSLVFSQ